MMAASLDKETEGLFAEADAGRALATPRADAGAMSTLRSPVKQRTAIPQRAERNLSMPLPFWREALANSLKETKLRLDPQALIWAKA